MSEPSRRVSMTWMLGLSKKGPFKDDKPPSPPRQPTPNEYVKMISTPGGPLEWVASDGRRHRLTSKSKSRHLSGTLASVPDAPEPETKSKSPPSQKAESKKAESRKAESVVGELGDLFGAFGCESAGDKPKSDAGIDKDKKEEKSGLNNYGFTDAEDGKLMELKNSDENHPWSAIAKELAKPEGICKARFGQIKPKDWRPPAAKKRGGGKKGKDKDIEKAEEKKEEKAEKPANDWNNDTWGTGKSADEKDKSGDANAWDSGGGGGGNTWDSGGGGGNTWDSGGGDGNTWNSNRGKGGDSWDTPAGNDKSGDRGATQWDSNNDWNTGGDKKKGGDATDIWGEGFGDTTSKKKDSKAGSNAGDKGDDIWGTTNNDWGITKGGGGDWNTTTAPDGGSGNAWDTNNTDWNKEQKEADDKNSAKDGKDGKDGKDAKDGKDKNETNETKKPSSKAGSTKPASKTNSRAGSKKSSHPRSREHAKSSVTQTTEIRVFPDDTFSAEELKQVARILHQDRALLWERVAHRFADKTGRRLPPELFAKKFIPHEETAEKKE